jgi:hypothetical protein
MAHYQKLVLTGLLLSSLVGLNSSVALAETVYQGSVCSSRVDTLTTQIDWYTDLKKAEKDAQEQNKLVFWMHMLGKIDGAT